MRALVVAALCVSTAAAAVDIDPTTEEKLSLYDNAPIAYHSNRPMQTFPWTMAYPAGEIPPIVANRAGDSAWVIITATNARQYPGSWLVFQQPNLDGHMVTGPSLNGGLLDATPGNESFDLEIMGPCRGQTLRGGYNCGVAVDGNELAFYATWPGDFSLGTQYLPWGDAWVNRLAMPVVRCPSGGECVSVLAGGRPGFIRIER